MYNGCLVTELFLNHFNIPKEKSSCQSKISCPSINHSFVTEKFPKKGGFAFEFYFVVSKRWFLIKCQHINHFTRATVERHFSKFRAEVFKGFRSFLSVLLNVFILVLMPVSIKVIALRETRLRTS